MHHPLAHAKEDTLLVSGLNLEFLRNTGVVLKMQVVQAIVQSGLTFFHIFILCSELEQMEQEEDV